MKKILWFMVFSLVLFGCSTEKKSLAVTPTAVTVAKKYTLVPTFTSTATTTSTTTATSTSTVASTPTVTATPSSTATVTPLPTSTATATTTPIEQEKVVVARAMSVAIGKFGYGIQAHMWFEDKQVIANQIKELGLNWVKQQVRWSEVETSPGQIDWEQMDEIVDTMTQNNIKVLFSVVTAPRWSRPNLEGTDGPPEDFSAYFNFVSKLSIRYCGKLGAVEVWNEQNLQREWQGFPLDANSYMRLLRGSFDAIQSICPSVVVVSGALTPAGDTPDSVDDVAYLQAMYVNGLASTSEAVGAHPSGFANPPDVTVEDWQAERYQPPPSHFNHRSFYFKSTMEAYRTVMVTNWDGEKQLWSTEFGWAVSKSPQPGYEYAIYNTPDTQARYIVRAYELMRGWGYVGVAFLWNLNFPQGEQAAFRILGMPAYGALQNMRK